jgi:hypothetical protein
MIIQTYFKVISLLQNLRLYEYVLKEKPATTINML